jgi:SH3 domain protein
MAEVGGGEVMRRFAVGMCVVVLFPTVTLAKSLYVNSYREVPVRTSPDSVGNVMATLKTGDEVSLAGTGGGYYLVMLPNGSRGYVPRGVMTEQEPAEARLQKLDQKTQQQIKELQAKAEEQEQQLIALRQERSQIENARKQAETNVQEQTKRVTELQARQDAAMRETNFRWFLGGVVVAFAGVILGLVWGSIGRKNRRNGVSFGRFS